MPAVIFSAGIFLVLKSRKSVLLIMKSYAGGNFQVLSFDCTVKDLTLSTIIRRFDMEQQKIIDEINYHKAQLLTERLYASGIKYFSIIF